MNILLKSSAILIMSFFALLASSNPAGADTKGEPLRVSIEEAVIMALENNHSLLVERYNPLISKTYEEEARAEFDPVLEGELFVLRDETQRQSGSGALAGLESDVYEGVISLSKYFPTGTIVELEGAGSETDSSLYSAAFAETRLGISVTQPLLRGRGSEVNRVSLRQAVLNTDMSAYELRGFIEALVARVENACWDYALAQRRIEIVEESLRLAQQQFAETEVMIQVGKMAEAELVAVQAEVAVQQQDLINATSNLESSRLRLLQLLSPPGDLWGRDLVLVHEPEIPQVKLDTAEAYVAEAFRLRPELNQARLGIRINDLEIVRTKNGLLPKMDIFITYGRTGYADSFADSASDPTKDGYDVKGGISMQYPFKNREARAQHERSLLELDLKKKALENLSQLIELDVRTAYIEVNRARDQIGAAAATRTLQEEKLRIETEKFRVGLSTNFLVSQAQRDLLESRINEVQSVTTYLKALIALYRLDGSLIARRGLDAPGGEPLR